MLFSLFGDHPDVRFTATSDLKRGGERLYLFGLSGQELGASEVSYLLQEQGITQGIGGNVPRLTNPEFRLEGYRALSKAIQDGLIRTAHDLSEGGLGVAIAEMCIGGKRGARIDLDGTGIDDCDVWGQLWGESLGRILIGVEAMHETEVVDRLEEYGLTLMGLVTESQQLVIEDGFDEVVNLPVSELEESWKGTLNLDGGEQ